MLGKSQSSIFRVTGPWFNTQLRTYINFVSFLLEYACGKLYLNNSVDNNDVWMSTLFSVVYHLRCKGCILQLDLNNGLISLYYNNDISKSVNTFYNIHIIQSTFSLFKKKQDLMYSVYRQFRTYQKVRFACLLTVPVIQLNYLVSVSVSFCLDIQLVCMQEQSTLYFRSLRKNIFSYFVVNSIVFIF